MPSASRQSFHQGQRQVRQIPSTRRIRRYRKGLHLIPRTERELFKELRAWRKKATQFDDVAGVPVIYILFEEGAKIVRMFDRNNIRAAYLQEATFRPELLLRIMQEYQDGAGQEETAAKLEACAATIKSWQARLH